MQDFNLEKFDAVRVTNGLIENKHIFVFFQNFLYYHVLFGTLLADCLRNSLSYLFIQRLKFGHFSYVYVTLFSDSFQKIIVY